MFGFLGNIGPWELILILAVALMIFGPGKLPEVAKSMGKAANEFKKASAGIRQEFSEAMNTESEKTKPDLSNDKNDVFNTGTADNPAQSPAAPAEEENRPEKPPSDGDQESEQLH